MTCPPSADVPAGGGRGRRQSGQTLVLGAVCMAALMGMAALSVDIGAAYFQKTKLQTVADSAAVAGASELQYGDVATGAQRAAALNSFTDGSNGDTLTVNNPPLSGPHSGNAQYVEVIATQSQPTYFLKVFGIHTVNIHARAVGYLGAGPGCVYALDPSASGAVTLNGTFNVHLQCAMYVDSKASQALLANGSGAVSAKSVGVVGGYLANGPVSITPTPVGGMIPLSDPLAYLAPPSTAGSCTSPTVINGSGTFTINAGVYCSTLIINGSPNVIVNPGTYVFKNGIIMNGTPRLTGSGVTFYNAGGGLTLNGSGSSNLSAPTTGPYAGILVFQSRSDSSQLTINGSTSSVFNGAVYSPDARIVDNGSGTASAYSLLIGDTITINGSDTLNDNYSSLPAGSPIKAALLVE
ncbi:MAG TPA: pilus assembly protein TadG-related protein [Terriglobales bacterium]